MTNQKFNWIYMRTLEPTQDGRIPVVEMADDFLRGANGKPIDMTFGEAARAVTARNNGRSYGYGSERDIRNAIYNGSYKEGDVFPSWKTDLDGVFLENRCSEQPQNLRALLQTQDPAVDKIAAALPASAPNEGQWILSGTTSLANHEYAYPARLSPGTIYFGHNNLHSPIIVSRVRLLRPTP